MQAAWNERHMLIIYVDMSISGTIPQKVYIVAFFVQYWKDVGAEDDEYILFPSIHHAFETQVLRYPSSTTHS